MNKVLETTQELVIVIKGIKYKVLDIRFNNNILWQLKGVVPNADDFIVSKSDLHLTNNNNFTDTFDVITNYPWTFN